MIDVALIDYLISLMKQLDENEDDKIKIFTIIHLISYIDEYRQEFIMKQGLALMIQWYQKYDHSSQFSRFSSCLVSLLQGKLYK